LTAASIGRFTNTHAITVQSFCVDCHGESLIDLNDSKHIGSMRGDHSVVIDNYVYVANITGTKGDINGLCMSCHNVRSKDFGFEDYYYILKNNASSINGLVFWELGQNYTEIVGYENNSVDVVIGVEDIYPLEESVTIDVAIILANFSEHQNSSNISVGDVKILDVNQSMTVTMNDIYPDYYTVRLSIGGNWSSVVLNVSTGNYSQLRFQESNGSLDHNYILPADFPLQYSYMTYFHTENTYKVERADNVIDDMRDMSVESISFNEIMEDNIGNVSRYTCSSSGTLCHINQKMAYTGDMYGIRGGKYYSHDMSYSVGICKNCHL